MNFTADAQFLDSVDLMNVPAFSGSNTSPLDKVPVVGFLEAGGTNGFQTRQSPYVSELQPFSSPLKCQPLKDSGEGYFAYESRLRLGEPLSTALDHDSRRTTLHSVDSSISTFDYPHTPSKLLTEPARLSDSNPFTIHSLDFLKDSSTGTPEATRSVRLKLATAPAEIVISKGKQDVCRRTSLGGVCSSQLRGSLQPAERSTTSGSVLGLAGTLPVAPKTDAQRGVTGLDLSEALEEAVGGSLPSVSNSSGQQGTDDWHKSESRRASDRTSISANPRKTEQNRRAQARFRQRKKDMFVEQQRQIQELTNKLEKAMQEKKNYQEKTSMLQQMVEAKEKRIEALKSQKKDNLSLEELIDAHWEFVMELKRGRQGLMHTRETVAEMVKALLNWNSPALGFIRREVVEQLAECIKQNGEQIDTPANLWMNDLVNAYEKMLHRCGETHPQAFRMFLGIQLPEQEGRSADVEFWKKVLDAGVLRIDQRAQLAAARNNLISKMQQLVSRRRDIARLVQAGGPEGTLNQQPLLGNMAQAQHVLDLHGQILKEEQAAVFNFLTIVRLVLEPVQQAKLMVASYPFAPDTLAICSLIADSENSLSMLNGNIALLSQLPSDSPFQALTPNAALLQRSYG